MIREEHTLSEQPEAFDGNGRLQEQIEYYRARSGEYDEWVYRHGRYDHGPAANQQWFAEQAEVAAALAAFGPRGQVLEFAGGTGFWTEKLRNLADTVTVVDASPEMLALNRARVGTDRVRQIQADIFQYRPDRAYDIVFFGFWLSHVPPDRFVEFWNLVRASLAPGGRVFFVDSRFNQESTARDQRLDRPDDTTSLRRINDGREFRIVKIFYRPDDLTARLAALGWTAEVTTTASHFVYGWAKLAERRDQGLEAEGLG